MRLSLRFIIPLLLAVGAIAYAVVPLVDELTLRWFMRDLDIRATLIANTVQDPLQDLVRTRNRARILQLFSRITRDERLFAIAFWRRRLAGVLPVPRAAVRLPPVEGRVPRAPRLARSHRRRLAGGA